MNILEIENLRICFYRDFGFINAVEGVSFAMEKGEVLALIGESGSGKTVTALAILGLLDSFPGVVSGEIRFEGENFLEELGDCCSVAEENGAVARVEKYLRWERRYQKRMEKVRGNRIAMIFQEPLSCLDPYFKVGEQIEEVLLRRWKCAKPAETRELAEAWLERVAFKHPKIVYNYYPHELSGGMAQRAMIALALCSEPQLLIADEPTTALDATIQKEILLLLARLREEMNLSVLFITHDMALVKSFADRIAVLYKGRLIEQGAAGEILRDPDLPIHPFTRRLLDPLNVFSGNGHASPEELSSILNISPAQQGCVYYRECGARLERCRLRRPPGFVLSDSHRVCCWLYETGAIPGGNENG